MSVLMRGKFPCPVEDCETMFEFDIRDDGRGVAVRADGEVVVGLVADVAHLPIKAHLATHKSPVVLR